MKVDKEDREQLIIPSEYYDIIRQTFSIDGRLPSIEWFRKNVSLDVNIDNITKIDDHLNLTFVSFNFRHIYTYRSFPILTKEWIKSIADYCQQFNKVYELAAGGGWITYWLRKYGIDIECIDNYKWKDIKYNDWVKKGDAVEYVKNNQDIELFILSWPWMDDMAANIFESMRSGQRILYVGEGYGGCTANDRFFKLVENKKEETNIEDNFISFWGIHDYPSVYVKE